MRLAQHISRLLLLVFLVSLVGGTTVAYARYLIPALDSPSLLTGSISGQLANASTIQTVLPFSITATGLLTDGVSIASTTVTRISPTYVFTPLLVGDANVGYDPMGYTNPSTPVTWTVTATAPAACYGITPISYTVYLTSDNNIAEGIDFTPTYIASPMSVTMLLTEVVGVTSPTLTEPVIVPPTYPAYVNNLFDVQFKLTRSDGVHFLSPVLPSNTPFTFTNLLADEPPDGSCSWVYTATVAAIRPYMDVVPWTVIPAQGVSIVVEPGSTPSSAHFITYHFAAYVPFFADTPDP